MLFLIRATATAAFLAATATSASASEASPEGGGGVAEPERRRSLLRDELRSYISDVVKVLTSANALASGPVAGTAGEGVNEGGDRHPNGYAALLRLEEGEKTKGADAALGENRSGSVEQNEEDEAEHCPDEITEAANCLAEDSASDLLGCVDCFYSAFGSLPNKTACVDARNQLCETPCLACGGCAGTVASLLLCTLGCPRYCAGDSCSEVDAEFSACLESLPEGDCNSCIQSKLPDLVRSCADLEGFVCRALDECPCGSCGESFLNYVDCHLGCQLSCDTSCKSGGEPCSGQDTCCKPLQCLEKLARGRIARQCVLASRCRGNNVSCQDKPGSCCKSTPCRAKKVQGKFRKFCLPSSTSRFTCGRGGDRCSPKKKCCEGFGCKKAKLNGKVVRKCICGNTNKPCGKRHPCCNNFKCVGVSGKRKCVPI